MEGGCRAGGAVIGLGSWVGCELEGSGQDVSHLHRQWWFGFRILLSFCSLFKIIESFLEQL
jgi:hypothetical protein